VRAHFAEVDSTQILQVVEELWLEMVSLFGRDGLWTFKVRYPAGE
jgi:hypothetical protein